MDGHGLSREAWKLPQKFPTTLLPAVDRLDRRRHIAWLKERSVDVIVRITWTSTGPGCVALVNPQVAGDASAFHLAFHNLPSFVPSASHLNSRTHWSNTDAKQPARRGEFDLRPLLDLVALGTIADIVPLIGENRILFSRAGTVETTQRPGRWRSSKFSTPADLAR
jgi:single-stranded-DNA-specific exonuclease